MHVLMTDVRAKPPCHICFHIPHAQDGTPNEYTIHAERKNHASRETNTYAIVLLCRSTKGNARRLSLRSPTQQASVVFPSRGAAATTSEPPSRKAQLTDVDRTHRCYLYFQPISHCPRNVRLIEQTSKANHFAIGKWQARLS